MPRNLQTNTPESVGVPVEFFQPAAGTEYKEVKYILFTAATGCVVTPIGNGVSAGANVTLPSGMFALNMWHPLGITKVVSATTIGDIWLAR